MSELVLSCSFANEEVTQKSYYQLHKTMKTNPCEVWVWDNHYPTNREGLVKDICSKYGYVYMHMGENVGMYEAYNRLQQHIQIFNRDNTTAIFYDGDNNPQQDDWHLALQKVIKYSNRVVTATLLNEVNNREVRERGFEFETINGIRCMITRHACTNTACAFDLGWLNKIGGLRGKYYYGGNEIAMWDYYNPQERWVFLQDYSEGKDEMMNLHDWQYHQYKLLYAHKGMDMSYSDYLKTNPTKQNIVI